jgi:hypothetical protein
MGFDVFIPNSSPNDHEFEFSSGQLNIFQIKYTIIIKSMLDTVKFTAPVVENGVSRFTMNLRLKNFDSTLSFFECRCRHIASVPSDQSSHIWAC